MRGAHVLTKKKSEKSVPQHIYYAKSLGNDFVVENACLLSSALCCCCCLTACCLPILQIPEEILRSQFLGLVTNKN